MARHRSNGTLLAVATALVAGLLAVSCHAPVTGTAILRTSGPDLRAPGAVVAAQGPGGPAHAMTRNLSSVPAATGSTVFLSPGQSWSGSFPASSSFELDDVQAQIPAIGCCVTQYSENAPSSSGYPLYPNFTDSFTITINGTPAPQDLLSCRPYGTGDGFGETVRHFSIVPYLLIPFTFYDPRASAWRALGPATDSPPFPEAPGYFGPCGWNRIWDVSSVLGWSKGLQVEVKNVGNAVLEFTPPSFSPTPISIAATPSYFSPHTQSPIGGTNVVINSGSPWELVAYHNGVPLGILATGSTDATESWSGDFPLGSGNTLMDGEYTLLAQQLLPSAPSVIATVDIDTTPPVIDAAKLAYIQETGSGSFYTMGIAAHDPPVGGIASGIDPKTIQLTYTDADFQPLGENVLPGGTVQVHSQLLYAPKSSTVLRWVAQIRDRAGNLSQPVYGKYSANLVVAGRLVTAGIPGTSAGKSAADFSAQSLDRGGVAGGPVSPDKIPQNGSVVYSNCGLESIIDLFPLFLSDVPVSGEWPYGIINKSGRIYLKGHFYFHSCGGDVAGCLPETVEVKWDGQGHTLEVPSGPAPTGVYYAQALDPAGEVQDMPGEPWVRETPGRTPVKVSDAPCVTRVMWEEAAPAKQNERAAAHTLLRHIVINSGRQELDPDYFGALANDPSLALPDGSDRAYSEDDKGYLQTKLFMLQPQYLTIMKIASAVREIGLAPKTQRDPGTRVAPVVLPNYRVRWVMVRPPNFPLTWPPYIGGTFPAYAEQRVREQTIR